MNTSRQAAFLLHAAFVLTGVVTTLLGPILPILVGRWGLQDWQAGLLFTMQFSGSILGVAASSFGMTRLGFRRTLVAGIALMAIGVAAVSAGPRTAAFAAVFCYGVGLGLTIPTTNLAVARQNPERRAAALNLLNLAWGAGAVAAPAVIGFFERTGNTRLGLFSISAALLLVGLGVSRTTLDSPGVTSSRDAVHNAAIRWNRGVLLFGTVLFLYVGTETAVAGWSGVYGARLSLVPAAGAVAAPAAFWAMLLLGRGAAPLVLSRLSEERLLIASLLLAAAGIALLLATSSALTFFAAVAAAGLGLSTVFPTTVAVFTREFGPEAERAAGPVFALSGLGGAALPPLVGVISGQRGSLRDGMLVPLIACLLMTGLLYWRKPPRQT